MGIAHAATITILEWISGMLQSHERQRLREGISGHYCTNSVALVTMLAVPISTSLVGGNTSWFSNYRIKLTWKRWIILTYKKDIFPWCAHAHASEVYGSVFVCLSVYTATAAQSASKSFYRVLVFFLDRNLWICKIMLRSRYSYLECHCRTVRSKTCPWSVATLLTCS